MAVALTISETAGGTGLTDTLNGGALGIDLGNVKNGAYVPLGTSQATNDGKQNFYIRHNAVNDPITSVKVFIDSITPALSGGNTYGGVKTAAQDKTDLIGMGSSSGSSKDNTDGLSGGVWVDMDWIVNDTNRFNRATRQANVKIFGKSDAGLDGTSDATAFTIHQDAMLFFNGTTEIDATAPAAGSIGKSTDSALGNRSLLQLRLYIANAWPDGGILQFSAGLQFQHTS